MFFNWPTFTRNVWEGMQWVLTKACSTSSFPGSSSGWEGEDALAEKTWLLRHCASSRNGDVDPDLATRPKRHLVELLKSEAHSSGRAARIHPFLPLRVNEDACSSQLLLAAIPITMRATISRWSQHLDESKEMKRPWSLMRRLSHWISLFGACPSSWTSRTKPH